MLIGYNEALKVDGSFFEYEYQTRIKRTKNSDHFACFKGNDIQLFVLRTKMYCRNDKDFEHLTLNWNGKDLYGIYSYIPIGKTDNKRLSSIQVVERIFNKETKYRLACLMQSGSVEYIQ
jgi:hypothetical protein